MSTGESIHDFDGDDYVLTWTQLLEHKNRLQASGRDAGRLLHEMFIPKAAPLLGIDLSASRLKLLELSRQGDQFRVEHYSSRLLPEGLSDEKGIKDPERIAEVLRAMVRDARISSKRVAFAMPDSSVITKVIQLEALLSEDEMEEIIIADADKYIPFPVSEVNLDFHVLGSSSKNQAVLDVLLVASRSENVNARVELIEKAGLEACIVDVESYAIERACAFMTSLLPEGSKHKTVAIIDIGANTTKITVLYNGTTIFAREESLGGRQLTEDIALYYGMSLEVAEHAKREGKFPDQGSNDPLQSFREMVAEQVKRALQVFFSTSQYTALDHFILAGGSAQLPLLVDTLQERLAVSGLIANPLQKMLISPDVNLAWLTNDAPAMMICCGLAVRRDLAFGGMFS